MAVIPYIIVYVCLAVFVVAVVARAIVWLRMPLHLRWELYPVAHEPGERGKYGGSYLEETDWWKKPRHSSMLGELRVMVPEILFLEALFHHNRPMWWRSFPFHLGVYLVSAATFILLGGGLVAHLWPAALGGTPGDLLHWLLLGCAYGGLVLGILGALGLLQRRWSNVTMRDFSTPADFLNLVFFVVAFGAALAYLVVVDHDLSRSAAFAGQLVTFSLVPFAGTVFEAAFLGVVVVLLALLVAYIPLTHMSHFVGKYFAYHAIRWRDAPTVRGSKEEQTIEGLLKQPVTWGAPHIAAEGRKNWLDLATEEMKK